MKKLILTMFVRILASRVSIEKYFNLSTAVHRKELKSLQVKNNQAPNAALH